MEMGTTHHFGWVPSGTHPPFYNNPCIKCKARWVPRPLANLDPRGRLLDPPGRLLETQDRFLKPRGRLLAPVGSLLAPVGSLFFPVGSLLGSFWLPGYHFGNLRDHFVFRCDVSTTIWEPLGCPKCPFPADFRRLGWVAHLWLLVSGLPEV